MGSEVYWTPEVEDHLLHLRNVEQKKWTVIGAIIGRSKTACQAHYARLTPEGQQIKIFSRRSWTKEEETELHRLRFIEGKPVREISVLLRKSGPAIDAKLERMRNPMRRMHFEKTTAKFHVPSACLTDRDLRNAAERDLTGAFFGDPPIGHSALERR